MSLLGSGRNQGPPVMGYNAGGPRSPFPQQPPTFPGPVGTPGMPGGGAPPGAGQAGGGSWWDSWGKYVIPTAVGAGSSLLGSGGRLTGQTVTGPQMPSDITGLRGDVISWLRGMGQTPNIGGINPYGAVNQQGAGPSFAGGAAAPIFANSPPRSANATGAASEIAGDTSVNARDFSGGGGAPPGAGYNGGGPPGFNPTGTPPGPAGWSGIFPGYAGPVNPATAEAGQVGPVPNLPGVTIGPTGVANFNPTTATSVGSAGQFLDPRFAEIFSGIRGLGSDIGFMGASAPGVRSVADIGSVAGMSQNIADVVNSPAAGGYFKDQVLSPYRELFAQQNADALAQAKEASGNLTGTGYASALGGALERLAPQQNATLSDILTQLAQSEQGRQLSVAGLEQTRNITNQGTDLQRALADAANATSASIANAQASASIGGQRIGAQGSLMNTFANIFGDQASDAARRADQMGMFNADQINSAGTQQAIANAQAITQRAIAQGQIDASQAETFFQGQLNAQIQQANLNQNANQFNAGQWNTLGMFNNQQQQGVNNQTSQNFLSLLLPLLTGGVGPGQQSYQPGAIDAFSQFLPYLMQYWGGRPGGNAGGGVRP